MYIPAWFREDNPALLHHFMQQFSFATLVTRAADDAEACLAASHLPFLLDESCGEFGTLRAHIARSNPQWHDFAERREALVIFQGPHAYISPSWYAKQPSVPTWNYAVVHAYGTPRLLEEAELRAVLRDSVTVYEAGFTQPWNLDALPDAYLEGMQRGIVGFEITITRLEGKFKMSQNRSAEDCQQVIDSLRRSDNPLDKATADEMEFTLERDRRAKIKRNPL